MSRTDELADLLEKHQNLCRELNMDNETEKISWNNFQEISQNFTLEGEALHWICCALYTACRESFIPTVGNNNSVVRGNCVSLTKLLRSCNISIYDFFTKIKKWIEMSNLPQTFLSQIARLERSFSVSLVLYRKYNETFEKLFIIPSTEKKNKKSRPGKCSASKLYDFCWCLFLCAKGEEPKHTVDLVTSFHLLLCCIDLVFANAVAENRTDLINPKFVGLPKKWNTTDFNPSTITPLCIMESLCKMHDVSYVDAKNMKFYSWKAIIIKFMKHKTLHGDNKHFMDIISNSNFGPNLKSLNNTYEQYVLSVGDFDERIFLNNFRKTGANSVDVDNEKEKQWEINASIRSLIPGTPLTRRHHLPSKEISEPVASATQNVKKLQLIAEKEINREFLRQAGEEILAKLEDRLTTMCITFCEKYPTKSEAEKRFQLAKSLYYNLLEKIVRLELKTKPNLDLKVLLETEIFQTTLIACCLEIVIAAYNSHINFPWILECFDIQAFHFYKIIEIVVSRHEDALTRSIIIHLNAIEEKCLDSLVWRSSSPLWEAIKIWDRPLPSWMHVENRHGNMNAVTPASIKKIDGANLESNLLQSPVNSAYECFNQPTTSESARKNLFNDKSEPPPEKTPCNIPKNNVDPNGRRRAGSLPLFCRKFYKLAYIRISELCKELSMKDEEYLKQIWTLFEYTIVHKTDLMRDRHLDQIIMCAIYVFIKVKDITGRTFTDIMKFYRNQPQAASNIYREVLIQPAVRNADGTEITPAVYNDIIQFYNVVYVQKMSPYILNFGDKSKSQSNLLLSPHPPERRLNSPRQISINHQLYIMPLEKKDIPPSPNQITYEFCKSPAKDLERINQIVKNGKRTLPFNDEEVMSNKVGKMTVTLPQRTSCIARKIQGIIQDRREEEKK